MIIDTKYVAISAFTQNPSFTFPLNTSQRTHNQHTKITINARPSWMDEESSVSTSLVDRITSDSDKTCTLARLAVAFCPPGHHLSLKDIEQVYVVNIDGDHIEIVADICEEDSCVTIFVPVKFPNFCGNDLIEECVLDNLNALEEEAKLKISKMDTEKQDEMMELEHDGSLCSVSIDFPKWWVQPAYNSPLIDECDNMRRILNGRDFQSDLDRLAGRGLEFIEGAENIMIEKAKVCCIGPTGLLIRARVSSHDQMFSGIADIPYPFGREAYDIASMREVVLGAMAAAVVEK